MEFKGMCIFTNNVPRLVDFYCKVLDIRAEGDNIHSVFDKINLAIWNPGAIDGDKFITSERYFTLMFEVGDVDKEYERLKHLDSQIVFTSQPTNYPWGRRAFGCKDPDGNNLDFSAPIE